MKRKERLTTRQPGLKASEAAVLDAPVETAIQARGIATFIPDAPDEIMYMPGGTHVIAATKAGKPFKCSVTITPATANVLQASLLKFVQDRAPHRPFFDRDHEEKEAMGWPVQFAWRNDPEPGVYAKVEWSDRGAQAIRGKSYRAFSPAFFTDDKDPANVTAMDFCGGSLVNKPAFRKISPLWCKESVKANGVDDNNADDITEDDRKAGKLAKEAFTTGKNPASWVADEATWERAKEEARKGYDEEDEAFWPVVVHIYKNMGGEVTAAENATGTMSGQSVTPRCVDCEKDGEAKGDKFVCPGCGRELKPVEACRMPEKKMTGQEPVLKALVIRGAQFNVTGRADGFVTFDADIDGAFAMSEARLKEMLDTKRAKPIYAEAPPEPVKAEVKCPGCGGAVEEKDGKHFCPACKKEVEPVEACKLPPEKIKSADSLPDGVKKLGESLFVWSRPAHHEVILSKSRLDELVKAGAITFPSGTVPVAGAEQKPAGNQPPQQKHTA